TDSEQLSASAPSSIIRKQSASNWVTVCGSGAILRFLAELPAAAFVSATTGRRSILAGQRFPKPRHGAFQQACDRHRGPAHLRGDLCKRPTLDMPQADHLLLVRRQFAHEFQDHFRLFSEEGESA